jgi:hypothetical protein
LSAVDVSAADLAPADRDKALAARDRLRIAEIRDADGPEFAAAYAMLAGFFLASGELEERSALAAFVRSRTLACGDGIDGTYHLVGAWDGDRLVGVRDCYVYVDRPREVCVVALSHSYVEPDQRRSGLAALFRSLPFTLARDRVRDAIGHPVPTLAIAEMEPADPEDPRTLVRLIAYGRSGFAVMDPRRMPYSQPEFRDLPDAPYTALPLLGVVRTAGLPAGPLPVPLAEALPRLFHQCHRRYLPTDRVDPSERHALAALHTSASPVELLPLPTSRDTLDRLAPLVRGAVLPLYPPHLRGPNPAFGDPADEFRRIQATWA